jgi:hypothetical protein
MTTYQNDRSDVGVRQGMDESARGGSDTLSLKEKNISVEPRFAKSATYQATRDNNLFFLIESAPEKAAESVSNNRCGSVKLINKEI